MKKRKYTSVGKQFAMKRTAKKFKFDLEVLSGIASRELEENKCNEVLFFVSESPDHRFEAFRSVVYVPATLIGVGKELETLSEPDFRDTVEALRSKQLTIRFVNEVK
jgi:hypothetical protein